MNCSLPVTASPHSPFPLAATPELSEAIIRKELASPVLPPADLHLWFEIACKNNWPVAGEIVDHPCFSPAFSAHGKTALDIAVKHNDEILTQKICDKGADSQCVDIRHAGGTMRTLLERERRKMVLYPSANTNKAESALDEYLRASKYQDAVNELQQRLKDFDPQENIWAHAVNTRQTDILRALLLLNLGSSPAFISREIRERINDINDSGLRKLLKQAPYYPTASLKNVKQLNYAASFKGTDERIVCRHIATYHLMQARELDGKLDYSVIESASSITDNITRDFDDIEKSWIAQATETYLVQSERFGEFLVDQFKKMAQSGEVLRKIMVCSSNHAMALSLRIKLKNGLPFYVAKFYDPNLTTTHARSASAKLKSFETQHLVSYAFRDAIARYYPDQKALSLMLVCPPASISLSDTSAQTLKPDRTLTQKFCGPDLDSMMMHFLFMYGFAGEIRRLGEVLASQSADKLMTLLAAKSEDGFPGLFSALQRGYDDTVNAFGELLVQFHHDGLLTAENLVTLLVAKSEEAPGFYLAFQHGQAGTVKVFGKMLVRLYKKGLLTKENLFSLIEAKSEKGYPAVGVGFQYGHASTIKEFCELLTRLHREGVLTIEDFLGLLKAKNGTGTPAVAIAFEHGHAEAIKTFCEMLARFRREGFLTAENFVELLEAKNGKGAPALAIAFEYGRADAVKKFGEMLVRFHKEGLLTIENLISLLTAKSTEAPGFHLAFQYGHIDTISAFGDILGQFRNDGVISERDLVVLLEAKKYSGFPGLYMAFQLGHVGVITAFGKLLVQLHEEKCISTERLATLLEAKSDNGYPGFYNALEKGHVRIFKVLGELLMSTTVTQNIRAAIGNTTIFLNSNPALVTLLEKQNISDENVDATTEYLNIIRYISMFMPKEKLSNLIESLKKTISKPLIDRLALSMFSPRQSQNLVAAQRHNEIKRNIQGCIRQLEHVTEIMSTK
jgi:hypothetical protein